MSLPLHLVPGLAAAGSVVEVQGAEAHHAVAVRRLRVGERVALTDGAGCWADGTVAAASPRSLTVEVASRRAVPEPQPRLVVVQALAKGDRGELAVQLLTEVGVAVVVPWSAARSVAAWRGDRGERSLARWRATAREAAKQARRPWFPTVAELAGTAEAARLVAEADLALALHEGATDALAAVPVPATGRVVVVVGPEGGLTDEELRDLAAAGARPVRLGAEVLRTSTAGVVAAAALLARTPRWRPVVNAPGEPADPS